MCINPFATAGVCAHFVTFRISKNDHSYTKGKWLNWFTYKKSKLRLFFEIFNRCTSTRNLQNRNFFVIFVLRKQLFGLGLTTYIYALVKWSLRYRERICTFVQCILLVYTLHEILLSIEYLASKMPRMRHQRRKSSSKMYRSW